MKFFKSNVKWFKSKIYIASMMMMVVIVVGILGFHFIAGYNLVDSIYMTTITITTVGYSEVHPLDQASKIFTTFLIAGSFTTYLFAATIFSEYITNGTIFNRLKNNRMESKIKKIDQHTIIVGYGRNGKQAVTKLERYNRNYLVIENKPETIATLEENGILCIKGDATDDDILDKSGVERAHSIILALPSDADNLFVAISAKQTNPNILIISRASNESSYRKMKIVGADNVIMPDKIGGDHMASLVVSPDLVEFVDRLSLDGDCETNLREISIEGALKGFANKSIMDLDIRKKTGCNVIGLKKNNGDYSVNPNPKSILNLGEKIIVLGNLEQIQNLEQIYRN